MRALEPRLPRVTSTVSAAARLMYLCASWLRRRDSAGLTATGRGVQVRLAKVLEGRAYDAAVQAEAHAVEALEALRAGDYLSMSLKHRFAILNLLLSICLSTELLRCVSSCPAALSMHEHAPCGRAPCSNVCSAPAGRCALFLHACCPASCARTSQASACYRAPQATPYIPDDCIARACM